MTGSPRALVTTRLATIAIRPLARTLAVTAALLALLSPELALADDDNRSFAGSVQLDYLAVPTEDIGRDQALDGATVELSLKLAIETGMQT